MIDLRLYSIGIQQRVSVKISYVDPFDISAIEETHMNSIDLNVNVEARF